MVPSLGNTCFSMEFISKHSSVYHLARIGDYVEYGAGEWHDMMNDKGVEFLDITGSQKSS